jgi:hypothetical protein
LREHKRKNPCEEFEKAYSGGFELAGYVRDPALLKWGAAARRNGFCQGSRN